jgi:hypothetical protein
MLLEFAVKDKEFKLMVHNFSVLLSTTQTKKLMNRYSAHIFQLLGRRFVFKLARKSFDLLN